MKTLLTISVLSLSFNAFSFGVSTGSAIYSNFKTKKTGESSLLNVVFGGINHQIGEYSLGLNTSATKNLNDQYSSYELGNVAISATHSINLENVLTFNSSYRATIATSDFSRHFQNLYSTVGHSFSLPIKLGEKTSLGISFSNSYSFFKYETDVYGNSNILHQHTINASLGQQLFDWLSASLSISATKSFTHNNVATDSYGISAGLSTQYKKIGVGIGYEKFDQFLDPSGRRANLSLFDIDNSMFNISVSTSF